MVVAVLLSNGFDGLGKATSEHGGLIVQTIDVTKLTTSFVDAIRKIQFVLSWSLLEIAEVCFDTRDILGGAIMRQKLIYRLRPSGHAVSSLRRRVSDSLEYRLGSARHEILNAEQGLRLAHAEDVSLFDEFGEEPQTGHGVLAGEFPLGHGHFQPSVVIPDLRGITSGTDFRAII